MFNLEVDVTNILCYSRVISLGGRVSLFSLTDSMFSMCIAMTRHNSKPWIDQQHKQSVCREDKKSTQYKIVQQLIIFHVILSL